MDRKQGLFLNVGEVLAGKTDEKSFDIHYTMGPLVDDDLTVVSPVTGAVRFVSADHGVIGLFQITAALKLTCSIDGEPFEEQLSLSFAHEFLTDPNDEASPIELGNTVDIVPAMRDELIVNIPMKPLCAQHKE